MQIRCGTGRGADLLFDPVCPPCPRRMARSIQRASLFQASSRFRNISRIHALVQDDTSTWDTFCRKASGEWEGVTATFDSHGKPVELPSKYVPHEYRDWGQILYDWQTISSTLAKDTKLRRELRRMMPTVGCEADSVAFTEEIRVSDITKDNEKEGIELNEDGSYSIPAMSLISDGALAEHCFSLNEDERVRIIQILESNQGKPFLSKIEVHKERKDGPYNGGQVLSGCGGGMPSFAETKALDLTILGQKWQSNQSDSYDLSKINPVLLPVNTWSALVEDNDSKIRLLAGVLLSSNTMYISEQLYEGNNALKSHLNIYSKAD